MSIDQRLAELGITLPEAAAPVAAYVPSVQSGGLLHISGQISFAEDGSLIKGRLGDGIELEAGAAAARRCGIMLLAQMKAALGSLDRVERIVKLGVFVNSAPSFTEQPKVANGASELMQDVFGEAGRHARSAVGAILPLGVAVEVDIFAQPACDQASVLGEADLTGNVQQAAAFDGGNISRHRGGGLRKGDAEFGEALIDAHARLLTTRSARINPFG